MKEKTLDDMLQDIQKEMNLLGKENQFCGHDYDTYRDKKEWDRLNKLYNEIVYFSNEYC